MNTKQIDQRHGPQTAKIKELVTRIKTVTPEQAKALSKAYHVSRRWSSLDEQWYSARDSMRNSMDEVEWDEARARARSIAQEAMRGVESVETQEAMQGMALIAAQEAILVLLVRDIITPDQFELFYGPWASVMETK
jgi:Spy/CpxP family protein refolding chaperone